MFTLHNLIKTTTKEKKRLGRGEGSGLGKNSGKGHKGQLKRSGAKRMTFEGGQKSLVRRAPKMTKAFDYQKKTTLVFSLSILDKYFEDGDTLDLATFEAKGLVSGNIKQIRVIKSGTTTKKLKIIEDEKVYLTKGVKDTISALG